MKYMVNGQQTPLMRLSLSLTLLMLVGFWIATGLLYFTRMDLSPASVVQYYRGAPDEFAMPRTYGSMIEATHAHLAMMAVVLLLLTHLSIFLPWPRSARVILIVGTFVAALTGEGAGWLVRFVSPHFAWLKIAGFLGLELALAVLFIGLVDWIRRGPASAAGD